MPAFPLTTREIAARVIFSFSANAVTLMPPSARNTVSARISPGCGGLCIALIVNLSSMIIFVVHYNRIAVVEGICDPPISIHRHRPPSGHCALECMPAPAGQIHIARQFGRIQYAQLKPQFLGMRRLDPGFRSSPVELLYSRMPKCPYHYV